MKTVIVMLALVVSINALTIRGYELNGRVDMVGELYEELDESGNGIRITSYEGKIVEIETVSPSYQFQSKLDYLVKTYGRFVKDDMFESGESFHYYCDGYSIVIRKTDERVYITYSSMR
jgi:hypothetical protein